MNNEDDEDTKILNLKNLNLNDQEDEIEDPSELEFETSLNKINLFGLNFKTSFFTENIEQLSKLFNFKIIDSIELITKTLTNEDNTFIALYYNDAKIINALIKQLKIIYPKIKIIIIANNLSKEKVNSHQQTEFAAHYYFSASNNFNTLIDLLK